MIYLCGSILIGDVMNKSKKRGLILGIICFIILIGTLIADKLLSKEYFIELKYDEVMEKINKKDSFILLFSQTTCSHCAAYKPKLSAVAKEYKINIYYLEVDLLNEKQEKELKKKLNYSSTPVTIFVVDGDEETAATRINGDVDKDKIISKLKSNGYIK